MSDNWQRRDETIRRIYAERGLAAKIARRLGIRSQAIHQWQRVPTKRITAIQQFFEGQQDVYSPPQP